ncbi:hypothetical protein F2Q69_00010996 [Brassica cretica]|uniref:Uncharacterized protein n=1 Tax=Brassica cretica TaxID=69181 RepID=A0A8S9R8V6_BRACR|nr:hypothetical protein F2Q69_00010996 [Brassica cretica]
MANSKVLLSDLMSCRCFSTAEVRLRPGMSSDIRSFVKKIASEMEGGRERWSKRQRATGEQLILFEKRTSHFASIHQWRAGATSSHGGTD